MEINIIKSIPIIPPQGLQGAFATIGALIFGYMCANALGIYGLLIPIAFFYLIRKKYITQTKEGSGSTKLTATYQTSCFYLILAITGCIIPII